jgi:hypothetical protein
MFITLSASNNYYILHIISLNPTLFPQNYFKDLNGKIKVGYIFLVMRFEIELCSIMTYVYPDLFRTKSSFPKKKTKKL